MDCNDDADETHMEVSERETPTSAEDGDDCKKVSTRIASVTLESDSLPETANSVADERMARRKKRMKRHPRGQQMDVDPQPVNANNNRESKYMDWDGAESHISSSDDSTGEDNRGREGDDEQSDWVGYAPSKSPESDFDPTERRNFRLATATQSSQMSTLQRRLERFALDSRNGEGAKELRMRERPISFNLTRLLSKYHLEIVRKQRGAMFLRPKNVPELGGSSTAR